MPDVLAAAHVRVETGRQHLGQHPERGAVPHHPAPEARMHVAHRIRQDVGAKILVDRLRRLALQRQWLLQVQLSPPRAPAPRPCGPARFPARSACHPPCDAPGCAWPPNPGDQVSLPRSQMNPPNTSHVSASSCQSRAQISRENSTRGMRRQPQEKGKTIKTTQSSVV